MSSTPANNTAIKCFAHHHLSPAEFGMWTLGRSLSHDSGVLYFCGRKTAKRFQGISKNIAYNLAASLTEKGWFRLLRDSQRLPNGRFTPRWYKVLSHDEWVTEHPDLCNPSPADGTGASEPVLLDDRPVPLGDSPVPPAGHNLILKLETDQLDRKPKPVPQTGLDDFVNRFSKRRKPRQSANAVAPSWTAQPVPSSGQAETVRDTQAEAGRISSAISRMGLNNPQVWQTGIKALVDAGQSLDDILHVAESIHAKAPGAMNRIDGSVFAEKVYWIQKAATQQKGSQA